MTETECETQLGQTRADLMQQYRRMVNVLLAQADLTNTNDMATLQALVTYLVSIFFWLMARCGDICDSLLLYPTYPSSYPSRSKSWWRCLLLSYHYQHHIPPPETLPSNNY